jgi:opacity protein-like surface antigen
MSLEKVRYQVGAEWSITKQHAVGAFYRYQHISNDDEGFEANRHLIGLSYKLKL